MTAVHATSSDFTTWTGGSAPANITALLRSASALVDEHTVTAVYKTDSSGLATDTAVLAALRDATCAQAAAWNRLGIDPDAGGIITGGSIVTSKTLDGAGKTYADASQAAQGRAAAVDALVPAAARILRQAGLLGRGPLVFG